MASIDSAAARAPSPSAIRIILVCFSIAVLEGIDIQSMGLAAPLIAPEFSLGPAQVGLALSASLLGLLIGALIGGRLADRVGRKTVLIVSVAFLGLFSLATLLVWDFHSLLAARVLAGVGMGGAFPTLIAITSESVGPQLRSTAISAMYCGMPLGGALAGTLASYTVATFGWRAVFWVGGIGPLLAIPFLIAALPSDQSTRSNNSQQSNGNLLEDLFGRKRERVRATALLWLSYFFTLLIVYVLLNWLPSLLVGKGLGKAQAMSASMVLNLGAATGSVVLGILLDRISKRVVILGTYIGMACALTALAAATSQSMIFLAALAAGLFAIGGQSLLYALSPAYYPYNVRGTGIGACVAVGRIGAISGPIIVGQLLAAGFGASGVLFIALPCLVIAGAAALILLSLPGHDMSDGRLS